MESEKSEFNVAVSYLNTINTLQAYAADAAINMNIENWRHILAAIFRRVAPYMNPKDYDRLNKELSDISNLINKMNMQRFGLPKIPPEVYNRLSQFEVDVLMIAKAKGLISKMEEDAGSALR